MIVRIVLLLLVVLASVREMPTVSLGYQQYILPFQELQRTYEGRHVTETYVYEIYIYIYK